MNFTSQSISVERREEKKFERIKKIETRHSNSLVEVFLKFINDRLYDNEAMISIDHFIKTNASIECIFICFINYNETGNTGKNYIDNAFKALYNEYTFMGITETQITEKYNCDFANKLYRSFDKFETSNNILKRITNDKVATRSRYTDTKQTDDYAKNKLNSLQ